LEKFRLVVYGEGVEGLHSEFLNNFLICLLDDDEGARSFGGQFVKLVLVGLEGLSFIKETKQIRFLGKTHYKICVVTFQFRVLRVDLHYQAAHLSAFNPHVLRELI
jgi:hypothetical protein